MAGPGNCAAQMATDNAPISRSRLIGRCAVNAMVKVGVCSVPPNCTAAFCTRKSFSAYASCWTVQRREDTMSDISTRVLTVDQRS